MQGVTMGVITPKITPKITPALLFSIFVFYVQSDDYVYTYINSNNIISAYRYQHAHGVIMNVIMGVITIWITHNSVTLF